MLLCETAHDAGSGIEDLALFAGQLVALGLPARVSVGSVPENANVNLQFDLAPLLHDGDLADGDMLLLLGADHLTDGTLVRLRRYADAGSVAARAFGDFTRRQTALGARARLSYVLGREPELFDLGPQGGSAPVFGVASGTRKPTDVPRLLLVGPDLGDPAQTPVLRALAARRGLRIAVVTDSRTKKDWIAAHGQILPIFGYGEAPPLTLAGRCDLAIFFGRVEGSYRLQVLVADLLAAGTPILDGSEGHLNAEASDAFVAAPQGLVGLDGFLDAEVLPNLARIGEHVRASRAAAAASPERLLVFLGASTPGPPPARRRASGPAAGSIVFVPTNGVGLGHAQRCTLVARALGPVRSRPVFAAFPSCTAVVKAHGFDVMPLIGRSRLHARSHQHDLGNYLRLRALSAGARALVFDGGFIFDSIYRIVLRREIAGVWIRRGLWPAGQDNSIALDREKAFDRVIVPEEAFDELNTAYSRGDHVMPVGPIVQSLHLDEEARAALRADLAARYDRSFERLAVTLLGSGVAAERGAQVQALCGHFERRSDTLHLVVLWPNATLEPGWFGWRNTRVVRTGRAAVLAAAADVAITAAGYNSFHEALYNRVAAIFVPQTGGFMDDQRARARAACDRGLATMVEAHELMTLVRHVCRYLDHGEGEMVRARLAAVDLPLPGTRAAAELIREIADGPDAVEFDPAADWTA
jgi:hypothetical protein